MIIPGILILSGNKTYGRAKNSKGIQTKLLYKVIPHHTFSQEACLIPYEIKHLGFSKALDNLFVTFESTTNTLDQVIGPVNSCEAFYEYQLYIYGLKKSITPLRKKITPFLNENIIETIASSYSLINNNTNYIFSIDPETSVDFDDAFSIKICPQTNNFIVSIYIANVPIWLDWLNILLDEIPNVSTIYLPPDSSKRPMLPTILSDDLCSLWAGKPRLAFVLDLVFNSFDHTLLNKTWSNQLITVNKNWSYSDPKLNTNTSYQMLYSLTSKLNPEIILDSHKIVEFWMCQMNLAVGQKLDSHQIGIFRQAELGETINPPESCPKYISETLQLIYSASSLYVKKEIGTSPIAHKILNVESYLHVTSPIRRLVDIVNMGLIQQINGLEFKNLDFNLMCTNQLVDKINFQSKNIRKIQNKCNTLYFITNRSIQDEVLEGWISLNGQVYIPKYKIFVNPSNLTNSSPYTHSNVKLYLFENSDTLYKKIKAEII
jgi:hypothetical protein